MDVSAVMHASDDFLRQLGLEQARDRLSLKALCARECATNDKSGEGEELKEKKKDPTRIISPQEEQEAKISR